MSECDEHDRCTERDKAECEWCMEEATTPANTTDQIATTTATRGDIASHEGDATTTAVVQDAQQYGHDEAMRDAQLLYEWASIGGYGISGRAAADRLAAHIERLEAERAKHAALMEAAKAVRNHVGVLYDHPLGWKCSICGGVAGDGHFSSCEWYRFVTAIADLEVSDD